ncbi:MAG: hypothetical protein HY437_00325 [Candidatus Magasanikbacteria bacterium]|nr:hypothetical protein [Candidatus Magasanikbacteria bacterium]
MITGVKSIILVAAALGMLVSAYSTYSHYSIATDTFCDINASLSCTTVNKSIYAEIGGIPVAVLGLYGYGLILLLTLGRTHAKWLFATSILGLVFSFYLTWIELFALRTICLLCVTSQLLILIITIAAGLLYFRRKTT